MINGRALGLSGVPDFLANSTSGAGPVPVARPAGDPSFSGMFTFGDSLSDAGDPAVA